MLKWAVGQQQQRRVADTMASSGCCKPPFRKPKKRSTGKENTRERRSGDSPRMRDSVFMRLDAVPMALRDVSNYRLDETPPLTPEEITPDVQRRQTGLKRARQNNEPGGGRSPERKKQPCISRRHLHQQQIGLANQACTGWMSASKFSLDSAKSTLQIEYSPLALRCAQSMMAVSSESCSPPSSLYYVNHSPSPIELDHKEIPLEPEEKEIILNTPLNLKNAKIREEIAHRLWSSPSEMSPLASQFNFLHLNPFCDSSIIRDLHISPVDFNSLKSSPECKNLQGMGRNCVSLEDVCSPIRTLVDNSARICSQTNNDRVDFAIDSLGLSSVNILNMNNVVNTERNAVSVGSLTNFTNNYNSDFSERESSFFPTNIDPNEPFHLRRQKVIRRRRGGEGVLDGEKARKIARSCLTLPDGIPSPFESPAVMGRVRRPAISLLTLPRGIPSPPTPIQEKIQPLQKLLPAPQTSQLQETLALPLAEDDVTLPGVHESTPESIHTWDSHNVHFLKTPKLTSNHVLNDVTLTEISTTVSSASSKIDESDEDGISSLGSVSLSEQSPLALVEGQSRSRRCLTFSSPRSILPPRQSLSSKTPQGELDLCIRCTTGFLTIHVIRGKNLQPPSGVGTCNAYIKVSMVPSANERTFHRTRVRKNSTNPRFDTKFSLEIAEADLERRVLVSAWHRDRRNKKSEFLGCMSFGVKHAVKREICGSFRLLSQGSGQLKNVPTMTNSENLWYQQTDVMANQSESSVEELVSVDDSYVCQSIDIGEDRRKKSAKKDIDRVHEDQIFLRHLELDPDEEEPPTTTATVGVGMGALPVTVTVVSPPKLGRTPFTTTRVLTRPHGGSFGFSIAWTHPPRVERVESGLPADQAGLRPGDYVIFVDKTNVVTLQEEEILQLIKNSGNRVVLEAYRKSSGTGAGGCSGAVKSSSQQPRSSTACSATTTATASFEIAKRRLHLPQVTFNSESSAPPTEEECRKRSIYQLLGKEQNYALCMQFGIARFMLPLAERKDLISAVEHQTLFQNAQELLRHTEDILEMYVQEETLGQSIGRIYQKKMNTLNNSYRKYCIGLKKADCLLVEKTRNASFMKLTTEPTIPKRRPDLTTFIHKPLEHYREVLKLLQTTLGSTKVRDDDYKALNKVVHDMQATYREITVESGLMEPEGEGRPLLSLQDLESRLVFTRCKPFILSAPGRQWIFGGDLSRVEGRTVRPFWALLFTDLILFAKVSRDRVIFVTEEPLSLNLISQALFSIRKKATEFRLLISTSPPGEESPAVGGCADIQLTRTPRKGPRKRTVALRAPTPELKAVWQNLIQRQIIYVNMARGGTPASSPMDSPDPLLNADSIESVSLNKRQIQDSKKNPTAVDLIDHRCRQLGKSGVSKGSALHLAQWLRGELGKGSPETEESPEIWSPNTMRRRVAKLRTKSSAVPYRSISRTEEIELSDAEQSTSADSQMTVKSTLAHSEKMMAVCRKCHKTCLEKNKTNLPNANSSETTDINANRSYACKDQEDRVVQGFSDESNWGGPHSSTATLSPTDPFLPVPHISVQPPTPTATGGSRQQTTISSCGGNNINNNFGWDSDSPKRPTVKVNSHINRQFSDEGVESDGEIEEPPYRSLSPCGLKRYGTVSSLEKLDGDESEEDTSREQEDLPQDSHQETVGQSLRGWTARAGSYVVEKMTFFERMSEEGAKGASFIDRYLNRGSGEVKQTEELVATSTTLAGEDECETSGATSGEDVWGTPTSGDSGMTSPNNEVSEECGLVSYNYVESSSIGTALDDAREQLMFDRLLSGMSIMGSLVPLCPVTRGFPQRRRLDPLMEDVEEDSSDSTSMDNSEATKSYSTDQGNKSDSCAPRAPSRSATSTPHRFFNRLKLRRSQSADSKRSRPNKFMEFLRGSKSEEHTSSSGNRLTRLFSKESQDDIPTTLPPEFIQKREHDKTLDRRFWKQLRKRRSSNDATAKGSGSGT